MDLSPDEAYNAALVTWRHRDPRRLIATAIYEWRLALDEVLEASVAWPRSERQCVDAVVGRLHECARSYRVNLDWSDRPCKCHRCNMRFKEEEGRWLLGWEGWWLCIDCIVGYVLSDDDPPVRCCELCQRPGPGSWIWSTGLPKWHCDGCWYAGGGWETDSEGYWRFVDRHRPQH